MLGRDVVGQLPREDLVAGMDRPALDVTDAGSVNTAFAEIRPDVVVNCAGYTAVELAETHEAEALSINCDGPRHLAEACATHNARLIHVSTDYVFPGNACIPYLEDDPPSPTTAYGRSKLAGERAVLARLPRASTIVRTAWLYGLHGDSFVRKMIEFEARCETVDVVADLYGQPTWTADVAQRIALLGRVSGASGVFHATNAGEATWYDLACEVFRLIGADPDRVRPISVRELQGPATRPRYTVLAHRRWKEIGSGPLRDWRHALREAIGLFIGDAV